MIIYGSGALIKINVLIRLRFFKERQAEFAPPIPVRYPVYVVEFQGNGATYRYARLAAIKFKIIPGRKTHVFQIALGLYPNLLMSFFLRSLLVCVVNGD